MNHYSIFLPHQNLLLKCLFSLIIFFLEFAGFWKEEESCIGWSSWENQRRQDLSLFLSLSYSTSVSHVQSAELMVLGFISLLLTFGQTYITQVCIPEKISETMLPCEFKEKNYEEGGADAKAPSQEAAHRRRLLSNTRRMLGGGGDSGKGCHDVTTPSSFSYIYVTD